MRMRIAIILLVALCQGARADSRFLDQAIEYHDNMEREISSLDGRPIEKARLLNRIGRFGEAEPLLDSLELKSDDGRLKAALLRADIHLALYDYYEAEEAIAQAAAIDPESEGVFSRTIHLLSDKEDLASIDSLSKERLREKPGSVAGRLARGSFLYQLLQYDEAEVEFEEALALAKEPDQGVRALGGLLLIAYKRNDFEAAADIGQKALDAGSPIPELLNSLTSVLIRMGEVSEAIGLARETLRWDPYNEQAHYTLGNGYTDLNHTELEAAYPEAFPDSTTRSALHRVRRLLSEGTREQARLLCARLKKHHPNLADPDLYLGTLFWEEGEPDSAIAHFAASLQICPDYGRAHNGFAKAMECKKLQVTAHRERCEKELADTPLPEIPGIERFVLNYQALSERHKKRVALSIEPWSRFVPVLVEAGATLYIKPLYERLSETPYQELLRDLRIAYDSRLWDDVRACGGFHTVTGIEDVERSIFRKYNTVLHELSHQVHYIVTPDEKRSIQESYRQAKEREESGRKTFVSRYQGSSVWEYFAEGMSSLSSPKRDEYDTREIVRERLEALDPHLITLIEGIAADTAAGKYYPPAYVAAAYDRIENGEADEAIPLLEKALAQSPDDESALCILAQTRSILNEDAEAIDVGKRATELHKEAPKPWIERSAALYHKSGSRSDAIAVLLQARDVVDRNQRYEVELALGRAYLGRGDLRLAREAFRWVLDYQEDNPEALWGLALAHGLGGEKAEADHLFQKAIRRRNGIVELRVDYARFLIREGRHEEAERQLKEARLLDSRNTDVETAAGLLAIYRGDLLEAGRRLEDALEYGPYNDLATVLLAHTWVAGGNAERAEAIIKPVLESVQRGEPPTYIYLEKRANYLSVHEHSAEERWILYQTSALLAQAKGDTARAREYNLLMEQTFR